MILKYIVKINILNFFSYVLKNKIKTIVLDFSFILNNILKNIFFIILLYMYVVYYFLQLQKIEILIKIYFL